MDAQRLAKNPTVIGGALLLLMIVVGVLTSGGNGETQVSALPSPEEALTKPLAIIVQATPGAEAPGTLPRAVVAFAAPGGEVLGPVEAGRSFVFISADDGWLYLEIKGSGRVWVRSSDLAGSTVLPTN